MKSITKTTLEELAIQNDEIYDSQKKRVKVMPIGPPMNIFVEIFDEDDEESKKQKEVKIERKFKGVVLIEKPELADSYITGPRKNITLPYSLVLSFALNFLYPVQYYKRV